MLKKLLIGLISIVLLILLFNSVIMPLYVKHTNLVKVPSVVGLNFLEGKKVIEDAGLEVKQGDLRYDETKPIGLILDQNPPAEQFVKNGRRIYLIVCGGEQLVEVPRLIGKTVRDAKFTLEQRNLKIGQEVKKFSNEYPEDIVISQIIQPGSKVMKSTKVDLIISNGPQVGDIMIPDLVGKKLEDARKLIVDKKLKIGKVTYIASDLPSGEILDQYPKKDKSAKENTEIDLIVAQKRKVKKDVEEEVIPNGDTPNDKEIIKEKTEDVDKIKKKEKPKENLKDSPKEKQKKSKQPEN
jgi:serine/threonine-protein kinase